MFRSRKFEAVSIVALLASIPFGGIAHGANLASVQGNVAVSRAGGPFQPVTGPTSINPGDVVRAEAGSSAQVVYADGEIASVPSGSTVTVAVDPAAPGDGPPPNAAGETVAAAAESGVSTMTVIGVTAVAAAGTLAVVSKLSGGTSKKTASP